MSVNDQPTAQMAKSAFLMTWIVAGAVMFGLMEAIYWSAGWWAPSPGTGSEYYWTWVPAPAIVIGGSVGGLIQWSALRKRIPRCGWWIPTNAAGAFVPLGPTACFFLLLLAGGGSGWAFHFPEIEWSPGFPAFAMIAAFHFPGIEWDPIGAAYAAMAAASACMGAIAGAVCGFAVGFLQRQVLRKSIPKSSRWIGISMLGWAVAGAAAGFGPPMTLFFPSEFRADDPAILFVINTIAGVLGGAASGAISGWYLTRLLPAVVWALGRIRITAILARAFLVLLGLGAGVSFLSGVVRDTSRRPAFRHFEPAMNAEECSAALLPDAACTGVRANGDWTPIIREFDGVPMALVPAGCFKMGSSLTNPGMVDAGPVHEVCLTQPFWIDVYEVTNEQVGHSGYCGKLTPVTSADQEPHECISWVEAYNHCRGRGVRLPTEAEWEYAARGPDGLDYPWGDEYLLEEFGEPTYELRAVGTRPHDVSWVGAYDLGGNAEEMTNDRWDRYERGFQADPSYPYLPGVDDTSKPVVKGSFNCEQKYWYLACSAARWGGQKDPFPEVGFRCARSWYPVVSE